jgi:DNA-binding transcriptional LysR family regulator
MFFFCANGHPLAGRERLSLDDLLEYPLGRSTLAGAPSRCPSNCGQAICGPGYESGSPQSSRPRRFVQRRQADRHGGLAVSAAIESQISRKLSEGLFVRLPIDAPALSLTYGFITKRGRTLSPAAKAFMGLVRAIEGEIPQ